MIAYSLFLTDGIATHDTNNAKSSSLKCLQNALSWMHSLPEFKVCALKTFQHAAINKKARYKRQFLEQEYNLTWTIDGHQTSW